jgi:tetratricopeptide (TPR) repeat protein
MSFMSRSSHAPQPPSLQELIRRRRAAAFTGRVHELRLFKENLTADPNDATHRFLFQVHGPAGVGKTSLLQQWMSFVQEHGGLVAYIDDGPGDGVDVLATISEQMAAQGSPLKEFDKQLATYRRRRQAADTALTSTDAGTPPSVTGALIAQAGTEVLDLVAPGAGQVASRVLPTEQLAHGVDRVAAALSGRRRGVQIDDLLANPTPALTPAFLRDLSAIAREVTQVALFFDSYEQTGRFLDGWLRDIVLGEQYGALAANTLLCLAGQRRPDHLEWPGFGHFATEVALRPFSEVEARQALAARGMTDDATIRTVVELSHGLPVLLSMLAAAGPVSPQDVSDPSGEAVELFLRRITDPERRATVLAGALPLELDEEVLRAAVGDDESAPDAPYDWLCGLPFVYDRAGKARYHEVVRATMVRVQYRRSPQRWRMQHQRLADHFALAATAELGPLEGDCIDQGGTESPIGLVQEHWYDQRWRELRRQETYHRLCASPADALPQALRNVASILHCGSSTAHHWALTLERAAADCGRERTSLSDWAARLSEAADGEAALPQLCNTLLAGAPLDRSARALVYAVRGHDAHQRGDLPAALRDLDVALETNPGCGDALYWRADARLQDGQFEGARDDAAALLAHVPDHRDLLSISLLARTGMEDYEGVLTDTAHILQQAPDSRMGLLARGRALTALLRYEEAFDELDRLVSIELESPLPVLERGRLHHLLGRHEQGLADFDEASRRGEESVTLLQFRACAYRELARYEEALSCRNAARITQSEAEAGLTALITAKTYERMGRSEDGLALLEQFVAEHPDNAAMLSELTARLTARGRHLEAVVVGARLDALSPQDGTAYLHRGRAYAGTGQLSAARRDLERAVELSPTLVPAHNELAAVLAHAGAWHSAVTSWTRALELHPGDASAYAERAYITMLLGDFDAALVDLNTALSLLTDEQNAFPLGMRARCHRLLNDHTAAERDLDQLGMSAFNLLERALLRSRTHGLRRSARAWDKVSVDAVLSGQDGMTAALTRLLVAVARADWATADDHVRRLAALCALPRPAESPSILGERGTHQVIEAIRDLRFLAESPGAEAPRLEALAVRLEETWI